MSNLSIRPYNAEQDAAAVRRIWREIHWVDSEDGERQMEHFLADSRSLVAEVNGAAECLAT